MGWAKMKGATFRTFWVWVKQGRSAEHYEKYLTEWVTVPYVRNETMLTLLEGLYGRKLNTADHRMRKFLHVPVDTYVKERDGKLALHREDFDSRPVQYLALPMGFGKTETILDMIREDHEKDPKFRCLFITCRKTLVADIRGRAKRRCIPMASYLDYSSRDAKRYEMPKQDIVIVQPESQYCVDGAEPYDCIVIDEVESAFNNWISLETHGQNYQTNWHTFKTHIQNCKRTIMMDAFPSQKTVKFCQMMGLKMNVIGTHQPPPKRDMINLWLGTKDALFRLKKHIVQQLNSGKNVYVFYPFKKGNNSMDSMHGFACHIAVETGLQMDDFCCYSADTCDRKRKHLSNVNESWQNKRLIVTNISITVGVSFTVEHFDCMYIAAVQWTNGRDVIQNTYRPRNLTENTVYVIDLPSMMNKQLSCQKIIDDPILIELENNINFELRCPENFDVFCEKAGYERKIEIDKPIDLCLSEYEDTVYDWDSIPDIEQTESLRLKNLIMTDQATMTDKITCSKHDFKKCFREDYDIRLVKALWQDNQQRLVTTMYNYLNDKFNEKTALDNIDEIINQEIYELLTDPAYLQLKKEYPFKKLDKDQVKRLFEIHRVPRKTTNGLLAHGHIMNNIFGFELVNIDNKNQTVKVNEKKMAILVELYKCI